MKKDPFPQTKDERFLLEVARLALEQGHVLEWVRWQDVANRLRYGLKSAQNMVQILARTYLLQKEGDKVKLTNIAFRHYGSNLSLALSFESPNFDTEDF